MKEPCCSKELFRRILSIYLGLLKPVFTAEKETELAAYIRF
jgi:hypothetical protein